METKKKFKKKVLIDLSAIENIYSGFGQIAMSYGNYIKDNYKRAYAPYSLTLLMPKKMFGIFGNEVKYISSSNWLRRHCSLLFPIYDVWHATRQFTRFKPISPRTKYILTIHDLNYLYETTGKEYKQRQRRLQRKVDNVDIIVCISHFTKREVEQNLNLNKSKCIVIYNGVECLPVKSSTEPNASVKKPFFFTIGTVLKKKNFHVLIDMMKLMPDKNLYIAGECESGRGYVEMMRMRIESEGVNNVVLMGAISDEEKIWLYSNCEAFLFPSLLEGFGLPVIEAMQFGKPVFSSRETSLTEIGGRFAFFWENFNPFHMKQLIEDNLDKFYQDKDFIRQEIDYANSFSYEKYFKAYEELYQK